MLDALKDWFFSNNLEEDFSIKFYMIFLVFGVILYFFTTLCNILIGLKPITVFLPLFSAAFLIFNHFVFYKRGKVQLCMLLSVIYNNFIFSPIMWLTNFGLKGGFQYFVFLFLILTIMMMRGRIRNIIIGLYTLLVIGLMFFELKRPEVIHNLSGTEWNIPDMMIGIVINMVVISFSIIALLRLYRNEQNKIVELSTRDSLTRQYNRRFIMKIINNIYTSDSTSDVENKFVIFIDVDDFKQINDTKGHAEGDALLINICETVNKNIREDDYLARIGGDEFLLIIHTDNLHNAEAFVKRLVRTIEKENKITVSAGLTPMQGKSGVSELLEKADQLMYFAKKSGKNRVSTTAEHIS